MQTTLYSRKKHIETSVDHSSAPIPLEIVIFPQAQMSQRPDFSDEERNRIKSYQISRKNKGFFIYRNGRLIRWGDDLGIVGKDELGFRARIILDTSHDDLLHVDVSKQRLSIPEELQRKIETVARRPLRESQEAFKICSQKKESIGDEGFSFNQKNQNIAEEDPDEPLENEKKEETRKRRKSLIIETQKSLEEAGEENSSSPVLDTVPLFEKVRYSEKVNAFSLWEAGYDPTDGTFVRINKNHSFYTTVMARLEQGDQLRQALEAILWTAAAAETLTEGNLTDVPKDTINKVLMKFKKMLSINLDSWCSQNQDIFDHD